MVIRKLAYVPALMTVRMVASVAKVVSLKVISGRVLGEDGSVIDGDVDDNRNFVVNRDAGVSEAWHFVYRC
jgi:hypothetical protein